MATNLDGITFLFEFLNCMNTYASKEIIKYRAKLNVIKLKKNKLSKLLKTRYKYEKALDCFKRYIRDEIWEFACEEAEDILGDNFVGKYKYTYVREFALVHKARIEEQTEVLEKEFDTKINILQHLSDYKNESKNRALNIVMLLLTLLTVIFIIFPEWGKDVKNLLVGWYNTIRNFIISYVFT